jgi:hypothetical protein
VQQEGLVNTFTADHVNHAIGRLNTFALVNRGMSDHEAAQAVLALAQSFGMTQQLYASLALLVDSIWGAEDGAFVLIGIMLGLGMTEAA